MQCQALGMRDLGLGERPIHGGEQPCAFVKVIHREPLPFAAFPQIGKEPSGILMKMQKGPAFGVEDP